MCDSSETDPDYEAKLLLRWQKGDTDAAERLIRSISPMLVRYFRTHLRWQEKDLVQDLLQDTLERLITNRDSLRNSHSIRAFAYGIARNRLREYLRQMSKRANIDPLIHSVVDLDPGLSTQLRAHQEVQLLLQALQSLPLQTQAELQLFYIERLKHEQIAEYFGVKSVSTMRTRMKTNRERLSEAISKLDASPQLVSSTLEDIHRWADELRSQFFVQPPDPPDPPDHS